MGFSITHLLILLVVVVLVFGTAKFKNAGKDLGGAVKGFKDAMKDSDAEQARLEQQRTVEGQAKSVQSQERDRV